MKVKEVADVAGVSVRTLHYYDEIGLLVPDDVTESGYRLYSEENVKTLQHILFFKALGFSLKQIQQMINDPSFDREEALRLQHRMLLEEQRRIHEMIRMIEKTIRHEKGEIDMSHREKFEGFDFSENVYEQEAREKWGDAAVDEGNENVLSQQEAINEQFRRLAALRMHAPHSNEVQEAIHAWYELLQTIGTYSYEAFQGLGELYVADERFTENIDQFGEGLASFLREAMTYYVERKKAL